MEEAMESTMMSMGGPIDEEAPLVGDMQMQMDDKEMMMEDPEMMMEDKPEEEPEVGLPMSTHLEEAKLENDIDLQEKIKDCQIVALYFSAHWCPPCRNFTPLLNTFYENANSDGKKMEIIFVSSDNDEQAFKEYFESMKWDCAVKYE